MLENYNKTLNSKPFDSVTRLQPIYFNIIIVAKQHSKHNPSAISNTIHPQGAI